MEFTITLTADEWNLILGSIQELPAKVANPLTAKIQEQANASMAPTPEGLDLNEPAE